MTSEFANPILEKSADPWMYRHHNGRYYFMCTQQERLNLWCADSITGLASARKKTIWVPQPEGPCSRNIWAPEIHYIRGVWYVYFTANEGGGDATRRIYVLENTSEDPMEGEWTEKGPVNTQYPGLDGTVLQHHGELYFMYAGYGYFPEYGSAVYIARMSNPWTLTGYNVMLTAPEYEWEKMGGMAINEGPAILRNNGRIFMIYSASTTWSEDYCLGMLSISDTDDLLLKDNWTKSPEPVFVKNAGEGIMAPGHNSFTKSADGSEDWIVYHAIYGQRGQRLDTSVRATCAQPVRWDAQGYPDFGKPVTMVTRTGETVRT